MNKKIILYLLITTLLTSCISVSVNSETPTPVLPNFVTATLLPTKSGFVPATLTPSPEITLAPTLAITAPANCNDSAVLLRDVTIPDGTQVKKGEKFTKTWEFLNNGTCPWIGYKLKFASGDQMSAPLFSPITDTLPKGKVEVSVALTAPSVPYGMFTGYFTLNNTSDHDIPIGTEKIFWVEIVIGEGIVAPTTSGTINSTQSSDSTSGVLTCNYSQNADYVYQLVSLINTERLSAGLSTLTVDVQLQAAAQKHSADMACYNFLSHTGSDGSSIRDRLVSAGYASASFFEIIAIGTPQNAIGQWRADPGHWDAVMNPGSTLIGVGYAYYANSDLGSYITVDFGSQ